MEKSRWSTWALLFIIGITLWRRISKKRWIQEKLHSWSNTLAVLVQWYTLFSIGMVAFALVSTIELVHMSVFLSDLTKTENLEQIWEKSQQELQHNCALHNDTFHALCHMNSFEEFQKYVEIPLWIEIMNAASQFFGLVTVALVVAQIWIRFILPSRRAAQKNAIWKNHEWHVTKRVNWVMWILTIPTVFCIETMRANTKVWGLITGEAGSFQTLGFHKAEQLELLYAHEDLEIASLIQFSAVYSFTRLISSYLETTSLVKSGDKVAVTDVLLKTHDNNNNERNNEQKRLAKEYKRLVRLGGFLGLWVYIVAGSIRSIVTIGVAICLQFLVKPGNQHQRAEEVLEKFELSFDSLTSTAFALLTVLGVITMIIMSGTYIITEKIGDANKKFLGARIMLLTSEIAPKIVEALEAGTAMNKQLQPVLGVALEGRPWLAPLLAMKPEQAEILKMALLNIACLVTVIMNVVFWRDVNINEDDESGLLDFPSDDEAVHLMENNELPLLSDD